jgi:DNA-binding CsgD family transcriptional regulator/PAS domain-containing protein
MRQADPIPLLYDAAVGEASWDDAVSAVSDALGGATFILGVGDPRAPATLEYWSRGYDKLDLLDAGYNEFDLWDPAMNPDIGAGLVMPPGRSFDSRQFVPEQAMIDSPLMQATVVKQGFKKHHVFVPMRDSDLLAGGFLAKPGREIEAEEARDLDRLVPHIGRALRLRNEVGRHRGIETSLQRALESLAVGVVVVDAALRILFVNPLAETIFIAGDGLTATRGQLTVAKPAREIVLAAVRGSFSRSGFLPGSAIPLQRPSGRTPYMLRIFPAIGTGQIAVSACATITVHDPAAPAALPEPTQLRDAYGLTPAEAAVASLVPLAESKRAMAGRLGVSENTVKTHLSSVRSKLGAHNLTELARMVQAAGAVSPSLAPSP